MVKCKDSVHDYTTHVLLVIIGKVAVVLGSTVWVVVMMITEVERITSFVVELENAGVELEAPVDNGAPVESGTPVPVEDTPVLDGPIVG